MSIRTYDVKVGEFAATNAAILKLIDEIVARGDAADERNMAALRTFAAETGLNFEAVRRDFAAAIEEVRVLSTRLDAGERDAIAVAFREFMTQPWFARMFGGVAITDLRTGQTVSLSSALDVALNPPQKAAERVTSRDGEDYPTGVSVTWVDGAISVFGGAVAKVDSEGAGVPTHAVVTLTGEYRGVPVVFEVTWRLRTHGVRGTSITQVIPMWEAQTTVQIDLSSRFTAPADVPPLQAPTVGSGEPVPPPAPAPEPEPAPAPAPEPEPAPDQQDTVAAADGTDTVAAADGADTVAAADGADTVAAADGTDTVAAADGTDTVAAADGADTAAGTPSA